MSAYDCSMSSPEYLNITGAAELCGVSVSTIRRKRSELEKHGAVRTPAGWKIPLAALAAIGLDVVEKDNQPVNDRSEQSETAHEIDFLKYQLKAERSRVDELTARVQKQDEKINQLLFQNGQLILKIPMIEAAPAHDSTTSPAPDPSPEVVPEKKGFFARIFS